MANWEREPAESGAYLAYGDRRRDFEGKLTALSRFLEQHDVGSLKPSSCFVTYINHVELRGVAEYGPLLQKALAFWSNTTSDGWLPPVEAATANLTFTMPDKLGRLHVGFAPAYRNEDKKYMLRLELTARGMPREASIPASLDWLDIGHEWIVRGFTSLTRPEMHKTWGRTQ